MFKKGFATVATVVSNAEMAQTKTQSKAVFGWWLYWSLMKQHGGRKADIAAATGRTWTRLKAYFDYNTPDELPPDDGLRLRLADACGVTLDELMTRWLHDPQPQPRRDARGRKAAAVERASGFTADEIVALKAVAAWWNTLSPGQRIAYPIAREGDNADH